MKYITLKVTEKEISKIIAGIDTLEAMIGTLDEDFNSECKSCVTSFDKVLTRSKLNRKTL